MRVWAVLMLILLAGCMDDGNEPGPGNDESSGPNEQSGANGTLNGPIIENGTITKLPWELHDCFFIYATTQANAAAVREDLPDGFDLPAGATVSVAYEFNSCQNGTSMAPGHGRIEYASVWTEVVPEDEALANDDVFSVFAFDVLVPDEERRAWLQGLGTNARTGGFDRIEAAGTGEADAWRLSYSLDGVGQFGIDYTTGQSISNAGGTFDQWTGGGVYWKTNWQTSEHFQTSGVVHIPSGSIYSDWYATPTVAATINHGNWDYTGGFIEAP